MQGNCKTGTAADYRASYKRVRKAFKAEHVTNAVWVWVAAAGNFNHDPAKAAKFLPRKVDLIGVDGYNRSGEWRSVKEIFAAAHRFAMNHGRPALHRRGRLRGGSVRLDGQGAAGSRTRSTRSRRGTSPASSGRTCRAATGNYRVDSSSAALAAYKQAGETSFYMR